MKNLTVGVAADPGLPLSLAHRLRERLARGLREHVDDGLEWRVEVEELSLPLDADGSVELTANSELVRNEHGWDYILYVTDLPKYVSGEPLVSAVNSGYGSALVVLPSLGLVHPRRLGRVLVGVTRALHEAETHPGRDDDEDESLVRRTFSVDDGPDDSAPRHTFATVKGLFGRVAMQVGMVRSNQPFRLVPKLSSAMAAASATGAFGIFYTSIWSMADYLSTPRLLGISLLSVVVMTAWLIGSHGLLERPQGAKWRERRVTYNMATLLTVSLAVATMFVFLFVFILIGGLVVINVDYMADQLGHDAGLPEYLNVAWLSASMGIIAGAVGSGLSDADAVRKATFSNREYLRRQISLADGHTRSARAGAEAAAGAADAADAAATSATDDAQATAEAAQEADAAAQEAVEAKEEATGEVPKTNGRQ
ncbi:hypothetical protein [Arthrobacter sp. JSM 101049]|uniref:hypothetical protein n=1 Tax=Arthrobacter sp. JSM 101049 TaxID=929097 RepID=UPI003564044D